MFDLWSEQLFAYGNTKWQWILWVRGETTDPSQGMQGLHHWMQMENVCRNMLSEAPASSLCIKGVVSLSNQLHTVFLFSAFQGKPPWGTGCREACRLLTCMTLCILRKIHFIISLLWPPVLLFNQQQPSQPGHPYERRRLPTDMCRAPHPQVALPPILCGDGSCVLIKDLCQLAASSLWVRGTEHRVCFGA